jgi:lipopolysaccharide export system protein LptA
VQRIRLLRSLLPLVLVVFVVAVALTLRSRPAREGLPASVSSEQGARAEGFSFSDLSGGRRRLLVQARLGRVDDTGAFDVEDVQRVEVDREDQAPLVLTAPRGAGTGAQGKRLMRLEGGVTLHDDGTGFDLAIPTVEVDQVTGVVRSLGAVTIKGALWNGTASAVVYSLKNLPAEILGLTVEGADGARLEAHRAVIEPGSRTMSLEGEVSARQGGIALQAPLVTLVRGSSGRIESATASPSVQGTLAPSSAGAGRFAAREARAVWGADGRVTAFSLKGGALVEHTRGRIAADRIDAISETGAPGFALDAAGQVVVSGPTKRGLGEVTCATLHARLDGAGNLRDGVAAGSVAFEAEGTSGESAEASFTALDASGSVSLRASPERRARLANARTRIVAETITSDLRGAKLVAEGRVESTLLPGPPGKEAGAPPMFAAGEAVHFVSASLESANTGARLVFRGDVRGWQGERTLSADEVEMIQDGEILNAAGHVATRLPRLDGHAASEADFVQVAAERLEYRGVAHTAEYSGAVRVRQAEGWLEAPRLTALLVEGGHGLREVQAQGGVRFEYRAPGDQGVPTTATGDGDRAVYDTALRVLRLFGDKGPATVRNTGPSGGTTVGRVLRYHLDTGALEVESGERDRATIKTPKG